jgi:hypothetical protein
MESWFGDTSTGSAIDVTTRYFSGPLMNEIVQDSRTIRNQGGGKNWRLAGDAIKGDHYDVRVGDLLLMAFDPDAKIIAFVVVKHGSDPKRSVSSDETATHIEIEKVIGKLSGSMAIISKGNAQSIIEILEKNLYPRVRELMLQFKELSAEWSNAITSTSFVDLSWTHKRLLTALLAKRFVILTGLSGSGKSLLARSFIIWASEGQENYCFIAVGANWTSNENVLGYPDAFDESKYIRTGITDVLLRARTNPDVPYFLLLDEMNLSHVERYFSDFLSAIESTSQPIVFHGGDKERSGVPPFIDALPQNLYIIGTVNVDETTYMFSPKVLDRANVLEFRIDAQSVLGFFNGSGSNSILPGGGGQVAKTLVKGTKLVLNGNSLRSDIRAIVKDEIALLFEVLATDGIEFGFRVVSEIIRYVYFSDAMRAPVDLQGSLDAVTSALDEVVVQKILPRIHGSRKRVEQPLKKLIAYSQLERKWGLYGVDNLVELKTKILEQSVPPLSPKEENVVLPLAHAKATKMLSRALQDGFVSFAEC